jgi:hypothetical protein
MMLADAHRLWLVLQARRCVMILTLLFLPDSILGSMHRCPKAPTKRLTTE